MTGSLASGPTLLTSPAPTGQEKPSKTGGANPPAPIFLDAADLTLMQISEQLRTNYAQNLISIVKNVPLGLADGIVEEMRKQLLLEDWTHRNVWKSCKHLAPGNYEGQPMHLIVPHCEYPTHMHPEIGFFYGLKVDCEGGESVFSLVPNGDFGDMECMGGTFAPTKAPAISEKLLNIPPGEHRQMLTVSNLITDFDESAYEGLASFLKTKGLLLDEHAVSTNRDRVKGVIQTDMSKKGLTVHSDEAHGFGQRNIADGRAKDFFDELLASSVIHKLQEGELAVLPNKKWTHARNQFSGSRKILAAFLHNRELLPWFHRFLPNTCLPLHIFFAHMQLKPKALKK